MTLSSRRSIGIERLREGQRLAASDEVAVEDPLEIRIGHVALGPVPRSVSVTMRTPGHDKELALGYLYAEGVVDSAAQVVGVRACSGNPRALRVELVGAPPRLERLERVGALSSSCGACGKTSLEAALGPLPGMVSGDGQVLASVLCGLPARLRAAQANFAATGGLHGVGLFDLRGTLMALREDVGRHNALDKLAGALARSGTQGALGAVVMTSRVSVEIVQKAAAIGAPVVIAVSAPTALAVRSAEEAGMTLVALVRGEEFDVFTHPRRITAGEARHVA